MQPIPSNAADPSPGDKAFPSTCWSRVLGQSAGGTAVREPDLEELARTYWRPVFGYVRAKWGLSPEESLDATQDFFLWVLESRFLRKADRERGTFRSFLKTALRNFLTDRDRRRKAIKRGGDKAHFSLGAEREDLPPVEAQDAGGANPDEVLDTMWRRHLVERALATLERELEEAGKQVYFAVFRDYFLCAEQELDYKAVATRYGITTVNVSNYLMYAKRRYRAHLEEAVIETVSTRDELDAELDWLFRGVRA